MDLWGWVLRTTSELRKDGRGDVARMIEALPSAVVDDEHGRVDAMVPEAVAAAKGLKNPWLEVFFRHWDLQSRVLHRGQGKAALRDAVALVELSHREETKSCPQSVCTIQDLCSCYAHADGPGYAAEREAASRETLARIDATWPCWSCVGTELATALSDDGRGDAALAELDRLQAAQVLAGDATAKWDFEATRTGILNDLGQHAEALELGTEGAEHGRDTVNAKNERAIQKARALVGLGRHAEASEALPAYGVIAPTAAHFPDWLNVTAALVEAGLRPNDTTLGLWAESQLDTLTQQGCPRDVIGVAAVAVRLALGRGAVESARALVARMEAALPELARPLDAPSRIEAARAAVAAAEAAIVLPETPEALLAEFSGERVDPEADLARLEPALRRWPDHPDLVQIVAMARLSAGRAAEALVLLEPRLTADAPEADRMASAEAALRTGDAEVVRRIAARIRGLGVEPHLADWMLGRHAYGQGDMDSARRHLRVVAEAVPTGKNVRRLLAAAAQRADDHADALAWYDALLALGEEPGAADWDRMISATLVGDWERVRASAVRLGMNFPGEGPIFVNWMLCKVRMMVEGEEDDLWARRTGPVTARIISMKTSDHPQVWGKDVVFRATPLNEVDPAEEDPVWVYPFVAELSQVPTWTFEIDGVRPESWPEIEAAMDALGGECRVMSGDAYQLRDGLPGVFACVVVPEAVTPIAVHHGLTARCAGLTHPLVWPKLAERAGDTAALGRMRALMEAYEIE